MNKKRQTNKTNGYYHFIGVLKMKNQGGKGRKALDLANDAESTLKHNNYPSESIEEHRAMETGNILLAAKELGQQNENS